MAVYLAVEPVFSGPAGVATMGLIELVRNRLIAFNRFVDVVTADFTEPPDLAFGLRLGSERYPELEAILPSRPEDAVVGTVQKPEWRRQMTGLGMPAVRATAEGGEGQRSPDDALHLDPTGAFASGRSELPDAAGQVNRGRSAALEFVCSESLASTPKVFAVW